MTLCRGGHGAYCLICRTVKIAPIATKAITLAANTVIAIHAPICAFGSPAQIVADTSSEVPVQEPSIDTSSKHSFGGRSANSSMTTFTTHKTD